MIINPFPSAYLLLVKEEKKQSGLLTSPSKRVFSGHMKLAQVNYDEKLEDTSSQEFRDFGEKLQQEVSVTPEDELYWFDLLCSFTREFKQLLSLL